MYDFTDEITPENARRYAETTDKLCLCADLTGHSVDSRITAALEYKLEALAFQLGYMKPALAIMIHFDGTDHSGLFAIYPGNEESEPDCDFRSGFFYCTQGSADYNTKDEARKAAESEAARIAWKIGGAWYSNE